MKLSGGNKTLFNSVIALTEEVTALRNANLSLKAANDWHIKDMEEHRKEVTSIKTKQPALMSSLFKADNRKLTDVEAGIINETMF